MCRGQRRCFGGGDQPSEPMLRRTAVGGASSSLFAREASYRYLSVEEHQRLPLLHRTGHSVHHGRIDDNA